MVPQIRYEDLIIPQCCCLTSFNASIAESSFTVSLSLSDSLSELMLLAGCTWRCPLASSAAVLPAAWKTGPNSHIPLRLLACHYQTLFILPLLKKWIIRGKNKKVMSSAANSLVLFCLQWFWKCVLCICLCTQGFCSSFQAVFQLLFCSQLWPLLK